MSVDNSALVSSALVNTLAAVYDVTANGQKVAAEITQTASGYQTTIDGVEITGANLRAVERKLDLLA